MTEWDINMIMQLGATTAIALFLVKSVVEILKNDLKEITKAIQESTHETTERLEELLSKMENMQQKNTEIIHQLLKNQEMILLLLKRNGIRVNNTNNDK